MDQRILVIVLGAAALAFASLAFATGGHGWAVPQDWNGTRMAPPEGGNGTFQGHGMMRGEGNGTRMAPPGNGSCGGQGAPGMAAMAEAREEFEQAVLSGDYSTAKNLSNEYGFGGPMFLKLNATTFVKYSQIATLEDRLMQELGLNATGMTPPIGGMGMGNAPGRMGGPGMMGNGFEKGMRHGFNRGTNQTTQQ